MKNSLAIILMNDNVRVIKGIYQPEEIKHGNPATLFKTFNKDIGVGNMIVVPSGTRHKMTTVKVVEVNCEVDYDSDCEIDWVIGKINLEDHNHILAEESRVVQTIKAADKLKRKKALLKDLTDLMEGGDQDMNALRITGVSDPAIESKE